MYKLKLLLTVLLAVALLVAGCRSTKPKPTMDFSLEQQGESLVVRVKVAGMQIPTDGHVHIRVDDGPEAMAYTSTYTIPKITKGKHRVSVELSDMQHEYLGVKQEKEIEIK